MKREDLYIGQKLYCANHYNNFNISEVTITGIIDIEDDDKIEIHIQSEKGATKRLIYFYSNGTFSDGLFSSKEMLEKHCKSKVIKDIQDLENKIKNLRLKYWELLCKK